MWKVIKVNQTEFRSYGGQEFRAVDNVEEKFIRGHAAIFNQRTKIGDWFWEVIDAGAFNGTDFHDVPLMVNHDFSKIPLARSRSDNGNSTLSLAVDEVGLAIEAKLDVENNVDARALYSAVDRGDLSGMSFAFVVDGEEWQDLESEMPTRRIKSISRVFEVSVCNFPAYETDIQARAANMLESAKKALENARRQSSSNEIEIYKLKNKILSEV